MQIVKVNFILLCLLSFLVSCQNSKENSVNSTSDDDKNANKVEVTEIEKETKKVGTDISMDSTKSYCYVKNIFEEEGKTLISVDFIQIKWIDEGEGMESYEEVNQNPKLRTFILNSSTTFLPPNDLDVERIKRVLKSQTEHNVKDENKEEEPYYQRFEITVKDGFVLELLIDNAG